MTPIPEARLSSEERRVVVMITILLLAGLMGTDIHLAALPELVIVMSANPATVQASIPLFLLGVGLSALVYGPLSDKLGRKPVVLTGLSIAILGNIWGALVLEIEQFLVARFVQGLGSGVCVALSRIILADIVQGKQFAITSSYITLFTGLSIVLGPLIGSALLSQFGWQANFVAMALLIGTVWIGFAVICPETNSHRNSHTHLAAAFLTYGDVLRSTTFLSATILAGIGMTCFVLYTTTSPFILQQRLGLSPLEYGWATAAIGSGLLISRLALPRLIKRYGMISIIQAGLAILVACGLSLLILETADTLLVMTFLPSVAGVLFSYTFIVLCASAISMMPFTDKRGAAGALYSCSQMALAFAVSTLVIAFAGDGVLLLAISYLVLPVVGLVMLRTIPIEDGSESSGFRSP